MAGIHEIAIIGAPFVAIGCWIYSPVWIRDFRLTESKKLLKQVMRMQTKVSTWPLLRENHALASSLSKMCEYSEAIHAHTPGLKGHVQFRDGPTIIERHLEMKNEARKMHLEIVDKERSEKALLLQYLKRDETKELVSPLVLQQLIQLLSKSQFQTSTAKILDEMSVYFDKTSNEEVKEKISGFMHLLEAHILLDEMLVENHNSALLGRRTVNYAEDKYNVEDDKYKWKDKNQTTVGRQ